MRLPFASICRGHYWYCDWNCYPTRHCWCGDSVPSACPRYHVRNYYRSPQTLNYVSPPSECHSYDVWRMPSTHFCLEHEENLNLYSLEKDSVDCCFVSGVPYAVAVIDQSTAASAALTDSESSASAVAVVLNHRVHCWLVGTCCHACCRHRRLHLHGFHWIWSFVACKEAFVP